MPSPALGEIGCDVVEPGLDARIELDHLALRDEVLAVDAHAGCLRLLVEQVHVRDQRVGALGWRCGLIPPRTRVHRSRSWAGRRTPASAAATACRRSRRRGRSSSSRTAASSPPPPASRSSPCRTLGLAALGFGPRPASARPAPRARPSLASPLPPRCVHGYCPSPATPAFVAAASHALIECREEGGSELPTMLQSLWVSRSQFAAQCGCNSPFVNQKIGRN